MEKIKTNIPALNFHSAARRLEGIITRTPLQLNKNLSRKYQCNVFLKREDLQVVRSYKIRGAFNMMSCLTNEELARGVVCASAGNHAQGFAFSCKKLKTRGIVFMPVITPRQKISQTTMFGEDYVEIRLVGDSYDDCALAALKFAEENSMTLVPPFDHHKVIEGQGTIAIEILDAQPNVDMVFVPVGGGGLCAGIGCYFNTYSPNTKIIGLEPEGAPSMTRALQKGYPVMLENVDPFVDGASVKRVGDITFSYCRDLIDDMQLVAEGKICTTILKLYNEDAIVVEPAGALSIAALDHNAELIKGKNIVCVVSGSNNDINRMQEIRERSLQHEGLKHYFLLNFAQRPGSLREFVNNVLGPDDDITRFEYMQKNNKEFGPALVGIELLHREDYDKLLYRMKNSQIDYSEINKDDKMFGYLV